MIKKLAFHSYSIIKICAALALVLAALLKFFLNDMPLLFAIVFFFVIGIYIGYVMAYYSIKYLRKEGFKDSLPVN
jgi:hypothetical protein